MLIYALPAVSDFQPDVATSLRSITTVAPNEQRGALAWRTASLPHEETLLYSYMLRYECMVLWGNSWNWYVACGRVFPTDATPPVYLVISDQCLCTGHIANSK